MEHCKKILVAPLDWGLGHATRCIPLIRELLNQNFEVIIASNGDALALLINEFPLLQHFELPGYNPVYPKGDQMVWKMAFQLPRFIKTIAQEHVEIERLVASLAIDVVISDNRYGCFSKKVKSVFITHQLNILMPDNYKWIEHRVNNFNVEQIKQYSECWVPVPDIHSSFITKLTEVSLPLPVKPIGYLTRFHSNPQSKKYDVLVICSGPEPQRSLFEELLAKQLHASNLNYLIVRGKPSDQQNPGAGNNAKVIDFLSAVELNNAIESSDLIIARSGYSTVMDLAKLGKKAIFIPTPGQTEQQYIAGELKQRKIAFYMAQKDFNLKTALSESHNYTGFTKFELDSLLLKTVVASLC